MSFPAASPLLFQTSIHPGGVQQVLIGRQQPVARLWPLAGRARLVEQAFLTALLERAPRVLLLGGEERGTWLLEQQMASERAFAFALTLTESEVGCIGRIALQPAASSRVMEPKDEACPTLQSLADSLAARTPVSWQSALGQWSLEWR